MIVIIAFILEIPVTLLLFHGLSGHQNNARACTQMCRVFPSQKKANEHRNFGRCVFGCVELRSEDAENAECVYASNSQGKWLYLPFQLCFALFAFVLETIYLLEALVSLFVFRTIRLATFLLRFLSLHIFDFGFVSVNQTHLHITFYFK